MLDMWQPKAVADTGCFWWQGKPGGASAIVDPPPLYLDPDAAIGQHS
jgi:hypothetical protein